MPFDPSFPRAATLWLSVILGAVTRASQTLASLAFARPGLCLGRRVATGSNERIDSNFVEELFERLTKNFFPYRKSSRSCR